MAMGMGWWPGLMAVARASIATGVIAELEQRQRREFSELSTTESGERFSDAMTHLRLDRAVGKELTTTLIDFYRGVFDSGSEIPPTPRTPDNQPCVDAVV